MGNSASNGLGSSTTAEEAVRGADLHGKVILITGANTGIGRETARVLAKQGATLYVTCRDEAKGKVTVDYLKQETGNDDVHYLQLELSSLKSVRACAANFLALNKPLHVLINNAGIMATPYHKTEDGFESQIGTNHFGHFLLTNLLLPKLKESAPARIVNVSSMAHMFGGVLFDDIHFEKTNGYTSTYASWASYAQSKTANILFTVGLRKRLEGTGVTAFSLHPGGIKTDLQRNLGWFTQGIMAVSSVFMKSIPQGAATTVYLATAPEVADGKGSPYFADCNEAVAKPYAVDPTDADRLWEITAKAVGLGIN